MSEDKIPSATEQQDNAEEKKVVTPSTPENSAEEKAPSTEPQDNAEEQAAPVAEEQVVPVVSEEETPAPAPKPKKRTEERVIAPPRLHPDAVKKWYVIRAISGKEKKVKQYIENEISRLKMTEYVTQVLIPTEKIYQIKNGKKVSKERNTMPGYVLIEAVLIGEIPHIIQNINGVINFLGPKGGIPEPVRLSEVNRILGKMDEMADSEEKLSVPFIIGESVKVIDGPFNGFSGVIEEINEEKRKLKVMVKIFGRKTPLELSYMQVEKE